MIDSTSFADVEAALVQAVKPLLTGVVVSNETPPLIDGKLLTFGVSGGGFREWGEAAINVGVNVHALSDADCRALTLQVQDILATVSNDLIEAVTSAAGGGTSVPRQTPPFQRYFPATVYLRGLLDLS